MGQCPHKKKNKEKRDEQVAAAEEVDEFTNRFDREFSLASFVHGHDGNQREVQIDERLLVDYKHYSHMIGMQEAFIFLQDTPEQTFRDYDDTEHVI